VVRARRPQVAAALEWLGAHAAARLTGTGSCIFAAVSSGEDARRIAASVPSGWTGFAARGLNLSPLHERLRS
jgi:4-diphosphocytidyl-2-C-methyl-D-erythritol kinase